MSNNKSNINFTEEALKYINAKSGSLEITKADRATLEPSVVWFSTRPFGHNEIKWENDYMLYTSGQEFQKNADIGELLNTIEAEKHVYDFSSRVFSDTRNSKSVDCNENVVNNVIDRYHNRFANPSQNSEELNDEE